MLLLFACCTAFYAALLIVAGCGVLLMKRSRSQSEQGISVIIAARNEEQNLPRLLASLSALEYPMFEVIIVNDHSTDASLDILRSWEGKLNLKVIDFQHEESGLSGKKAALQQGIAAAAYDVLAFTDADCVVPATWLKAINRAMDSKTDYLLGYSIIKRFEGDRELRWQNFERSVYYALAAAGLYFRKPVTSSACNLAYRKSLFLKAGGFDGIGLLRSGDDDLLLMKMMPFIRQAIYDPSPELQVVSIPGRDLSKQHQTNIRRASKFRHYPLWLQTLALAAFLYFALFYLMLFRLLWVTPLSLFWWLLLLKTSAELWLLLPHLTRAKQLKLSALYPLQLLLFPAQFVFYALRGTLGKYKWK